MALQGNLKDFSITDVLQLIGQQLKTGVLRIRQGKKVVEIYFADGMIVHVYSNYRGKKDLIGEIFVKVQLITQEQLERVLRIQKETRKYLGEIFVELQLLTKEDVLKVISTQAYETIYDLFWWQEGEFYFDLKTVEVYKKIPFALSTEQVLLNILRMADEWSEIEKKIFSPYLVFRKTQEKGEGSAGGLALLEGVKERLTPEQELVYGLVDGTRTVQEIIDRSLFGRFNASEILASLLDAGMIEIAGVLTPSLMTRVRTINLREILSVASLAGVAILLFLLLAYLRPDFFSHLLESKIERVEVEVPTHLIQKARVDRIKNALEIYYLETGTYPSQLENLVSAQLLRKEELFYGKGIAYQYELRGEEYLLKH
ncbi:MAG: DUF4388 domain-containing protein [Syntrophaceae bacterium]|nr:DUF4388 domain-containing protein [Syntrophaceae bacterium]